MATPSSVTTVDTVRPGMIGAPPTLSDLGLAAFLESLDTLEINPEDGLTPTMLKGLTSAGPSSLDAGLGLMSEASLSSALSFIGAAGSTSYAVPADLSWADPSWLLKPSVPGDLGVDTSDVGALWPRGAASGMGQGQLRDGEGQVLFEQPHNDMEPLRATKQSLCEATGSPSSARSSPAATDQPGACCCASKNESQESVKEESQLSAQHTTTESSSRHRVHCVPNPTGQGCTCLCDVSVALINVRTTLRQARDAQQDDAIHQCEGQECTSSNSHRQSSSNAASTLQLTLSASQAVAAQCACSASCPTCRSDPSTSMSASLLVSTALQIYVRAVRTLRQGFGAHGGPMSEGTSNWDVSIGQYRPKPVNARRIALFAMKLELRDLRDAIAKISQAACPSDASSNCCEAQKTSDSGVNPIDQVVIRKLHQQLGDLLRTVEGIEEQQDASVAAPG